MDRQIEGQDSAAYLWERKQVVPFLKVDKGLAEEADGVQLMKPMPQLDALLERAVGKGVFGTKMRSVVNGASEKGIAESSTSSSKSASRSSRPAWCRSWSPKSRSARPTRRKPKPCSRRASSSG